VLIMKAPIPGGAGGGGPQWGAKGRGVASKTRQNAAWGKDKGKNFFGSGETGREVGTSLKQKCTKRQVQVLKKNKQKNKQHSKKKWRAHAHRDQPKRQK